MFPNEIFGINSDDNDDEDEHVFVSNIGFLISSCLWEYPIERSIGNESFTNNILSSFCIIEEFLDGDVDDDDDNDDDDDCLIDEYAIKFKGSFEVIWISGNFDEIPDKHDKCDDDVIIVDVICGWVNTVNCCVIGINETIDDWFGKVHDCIFEEHDWELMKEVIGKDDDDVDVDDEYIVKEIGIDSIDVFIYCSFIVPISLLIIVIGNWLPLFGCCFFKCLVISHL